MVIKLDPLQQAHESRLGATDDPGQPGGPPRVLQRAHDGHDVTGIADSREPQDAHALGWRNGMSHAEDFALADRGGGAAETDSRRAMLYDASRAGNADAAWFDREWWSQRGEVHDSAEGRRLRRVHRCGLAPSGAAALPGGGWMARGHMTDTSGRAKR